MPKTTPTKTQTLTIRFGPQMRENIDRYAKAREMTPSEFVRYAARVYMDSVPERGEDY